MVFGACAAVWMARECGGLGHGEMACLVRDHRDLGEGSLLEDKLYYAIL